MGRAFGVALSEAQKTSGKLVGPPLAARRRLPHFAFEFKKTGFMAGEMWKRDLRGRHARVFVMSDSNPIAARFSARERCARVRCSSEHGLPRRWPHPVRACRGR